MGSKGGAAWEAIRDVEENGKRIRLKTNALLSSLLNSPVQRHSVVICGTAAQEHSSRSRVIEEVSRFTESFANAERVHKGVAAALVLLNAFCGIGRDLDSTGYNSVVEYLFHDVDGKPRVHGAEVHAFGCAQRDYIHHSTIQGVPTNRPFSVLWRVGDGIKELLHSLALPAQLCEDTEMNERTQRRAQLQELLKALSIVGFTEEEVSHLMAYIAGMESLLDARSAPPCAAFGVSEDVRSTAMQGPCDLLPSFMLSPHSNTHAQSFMALASAVRNFEHDAETSTDSSMLYTGTEGSMYTGTFSTGLESVETGIDVDHLDSRGSPRSLMETGTDGLEDSVGEIDLVPARVIATVRVTLAETRDSTDEEHGLDEGQAVATDSPDPRPFSVNRFDCLPKRCYQRQIQDSWWNRENMTRAKISLYCVLRKFLVDYLIERINTHLVGESSDGVREKCKRFRVLTLADSQLEEGPDRRGFHRFRHRVAIDKVFESWAARHCPTLEVPIPRNMMTPCAAVEDKPKKLSIARSILRSALMQKSTRVEFPSFDVYASDWKRVYGSQTVPLTAGSMTIQLHMMRWQWSLEGSGAASLPDIHALMEQASNPVLRAAFRSKVAESVRELWYSENARYHGCLEMLLSTMGPSAYFLHTGDRLPRWCVQCASKSCVASFSWNTVSSLLGANMPLAQRSPEDTSSSEDKSSYENMWSCMPFDILRLVLSLLNHEDLISAASVCSRWQNAATMFMMLGIAGSFTEPAMPKTQETDAKFVKLELGRTWNSDTRWGTVVEGDVAIDAADEEALKKYIRRHLRDTKIVFENGRLWVPSFEALDAFGRFVRRHGSGAGIWREAIAKMPFDPPALQLPTSTCILAQLREGARVTVLHTNYGSGWMKVHVHATSLVGCKNYDKQMKTNSCNYIDPVNEAGTRHIMSLGEK